MKNEIYLWAVIIIAIVGVALYFRYFWQPQISVALGINGGPTSHFYPYQKAAFQINVFNNGSSAVSNLSIGVLVNGNLSTLYKVTLPSGKKTTIAYNYSPTAEGSYNISVVADPGKLYNIADRSKTLVSTSIRVFAAQAASPASMLPSNGIMSFRNASLTNGGLLLGTYLFDQYNVGLFRLTGNGQIDTFLKPILNLTSYYIKNVTLAEATYPNNSDVYSIWVKGYLSPSIFSAATVGSSLSTTNVSTKMGEATFIKMLNDTTFCGWYSGGWLKILAEQNYSQACYAIMNESNLGANASQPAVFSKMFLSGLSITNASVLGSYSSHGEEGDFLAGVYLISNSSFIYDTISNTSGPRNTTCYGVISTLNGTSFCSTYILPKSGKIGAISLIRTTAYKGPYNLTAFSLVNASFTLSQVGSAAAVLQKINATGAPLTFTSALVNSCEFNDTFGCSNLQYGNGKASFTLINKLDQSARLNSVRCYQTAGVYSTPLNQTLVPGGSTGISTPCYNVTSPINGLSINLHLGIAVNYTVSNSTQVVVGSAFVPFG
jgi:archaellum component FlaF (FlaF/FlaG flagellin family)